MMIVILSVLSLIGCNRNEQIGKHQDSTNHPELAKEPPTGLFFGEEMKQITFVPEENFSKVIGWLSDDTILYVTDDSSGSNLYQYHLYTGKSDLIFESDAPVAEVIISPSKEKILLHTAPSTHLGIITIIDQDGNQLSQQEIDSFELFFTWNQFNEDELFIAAFYEDWTFETNLLDIDNNQMSTIEISDPFVQWLGIDEFVYLNWDEDSPTLTAPLTKKKLESKDETILSNHVIDFKTFGNQLFYVKVTEQDRNIAEYTFLNKHQQPKQSFQLPLLTRYSGWLVPYHDFNIDKQIFYTFRPLRSADADMYGDKFQFVSYDVKNDKQTVLLEEQENEPISLSPNGKYMLYGFQLEKIINLETKETIQLVDD